MQDSIVRNAVAAASMTCNLAVSVVQNRPRGSATWSVASTVKFDGRTWIGSLPSTSARQRPSFITPRMSFSVTARPPTGHCTLNSRDSGWPHVRLMVTERSLTSAISSACPTDARMAFSAASRSVMSPLFSPLPFCQPKPSTRSEPSLSVRPIRQAILVVPISTTPNGPERKWRVDSVSGGPVSVGGRMRRGLSAIRSCSYVGFLAMTGTAGGIVSGGAGGSTGSSFASILGRNTRRSGSRKSMAAKGRSSTACCC